MKKVGANCGYWEKSNLCERQQGEERICPYHGTGSDYRDDGAVQFSCERTIRVHGQDAYLGNDYPFLKCRVYDSISMGNGGKVNGIEVLSQ